MTEFELECYKDSYVKQLGHLNADEASIVKSKLQIESLNKGDFYLNRGDVQGCLGFNLRGLVRRYYINEKASEITTGFIKENEYVTDYPAFIKQLPTKYFFKCLEPSIIVNIPYQVIQDSYQQFDQGQLYGRLMTEQVLTILNDRIEGFFFNTAEERYTKFLQEHPDLMNRISLTDLSSYLGIERQSLTRIRKRLYRKD